MTSRSFRALPPNSLLILFRLGGLSPNDLWLTKLGRTRAVFHAFSDVRGVDAAILTASSRTKLR